MRKREEELTYVRGSNIDLNWKKSPVVPTLYNFFLLPESNEGLGSLR